MAQKICNMKNSVEANVSTKEQSEALRRVSLHTTLKPQHRNDTMSLDKLIEVNGSTGVRKPQNTDALIPFVGLTDSSKLSKNCCMNGGTCVLGSFCVCPMYFTGRYCEDDERKRDCADQIKHGDWVLRDCRLCRCTYGLLSCLKEDLQPDCAEKKVTEEVYILQDSVEKHFTLLSIVLTSDLSVKVSAL
ncbi:cryptic protein-like [Phyllobates terribilis]|uniref:cryptic protein-like n=1 Tax=Phyllobates terribilis TaxID=111132 RepID=UPI003CCAD35C